MSVYGFGGLPNWDFHADKNCFNLNGLANAEIEGTNAILATYRQQLPKIKLSGPTFFTPVLMKFLESVEAVKESQIYHVLLILTDGEIHDFDKAVN